MGVRLPKRQSVLTAEIPHPFHMSEKVDPPRLAGSQSGHERRPYCRCLAPDRWLARFWLDKFQADSAHIRAQIQRPNLEAICLLHSIGYSSTAEASCPKRCTYSGDCLRRSSQSKKLSGVSSQIRNHSRISCFWSRLCASTRGFLAIISAR